MTENDRPSGAETDWYASSTQSYGFGYTREQALLEMAFHLDADRDGRVWRRSTTGQRSRTIAG